MKKPNTQKSRDTVPVNLKQEFKNKTKTRFCSASIQSSGHGIQGRGLVVPARRPGQPRRGVNTPATVNAFRSVHGLVVPASRSVLFRSGFYLPVPAYSPLYS